MTIRAPEKNILDKILAIFGKERDIIVPENTNELYKKQGPYVQMVAKRESFLKALFRKRNR